MPQQLSHFHMRPARYILHPQDNTLIRLAGPRQLPWEEGTEIRNISLSGLAFTAPADLCPAIGEMIKIEFEIPGAEQQMASYSLVTRLEPLSPSRTLVGIKFYRMTTAQRIILAQGIALKLRDQQISQMRQRQKRVGLVKRYLPLTLLALWGLLLYLHFSLNL